MKKVVMLLVVVLVVVTGIWYTLIKEDAPIVADDEVTDVQDDLPDETVQSKVEIFADDMDEFGVKATSTFTLSFNQAVDLEVVKANVHLDPATDFELVLLSDKRFKLTPSTRLLPNRVYNIAYDDLDYGKAFQTADDIRIFQSFPGSNAYDVPVRSGIELYFNVKNVTDISEYFSISPAVQGTFAYNERSVVFMPESLDSGITYTVTVEPGLVVDNREMLMAYSFSFTTGYSADYNWNVSYDVVNVQADQPSIISVDSWRSDETYHVNIYQAPIFDDFNETYLSFLDNQHQVDLSALTSVFEEDIPALMHNHRPNIELPSLENGRYIVLIVSDSVEQYVFLQVDAHQVYYSKATNGEMFWVVDSESQSPENTAIVTVDDVRVDSVDEKGVLFIPGEVEDGYQNYVVKADGKSYIVNTKPSYNIYFEYDGYGYGYRDNENYWTFLYSDRNVYQQTDTVHLFGFMRSYTNEEPKDLRIVMKHYWDDTALIDKKIELSDDKTLTTFLDLEAFDFGYYNIQLLNGDELITSKEISILDYEKPEIRLESSIREQIIFAEDVIHYQLKAAYFNELAYKDMQVIIQKDDLINNRTISESYTTDEMGMIDLEVLVKDDNDYWYPDHYSIRATNDGIEDTYLSTYASTMILPRDIMIISDYDIVDDVATVNIETNRIDISQYNGNFGHNYENLKGGNYNTEVTVYITDHYYEKVFQRTEYDPIHKVSYDVYHYNKKEVPIDRVKVTTKNGVAKFDLPVVEDHYYRLTFELKDDQKRLVKADTTVGSFAYKWFDYSEKYTMPYDDKRYVVGDTVEKEVLSYGEPIEAHDEDFALHLFLRNGVIDYVVTNDAKVSFEFIESYRPNIYLKTIYYDGNSMNIVPSYQSHFIPYDYKELEGEITATTDYTDVKPGETVNLELNILDAKGQPFTGKANVSIVDEAYFALFEDYFNLGDSLHSYVYSDGIIHEAVSSDEDLAEMSGAEAGEGGDDNYIRDDFKDTALFETIEVVDGKGALSFVVPDNLSSWRITVHAVNDTLTYASNQLNVNVSLPYFVRALYNLNYMTGDEVYVTLKSDGDVINEGDEIAYTANLSLQGAKITSSQVVTHTKGTSNLLIGTLTEPAYEVTVIGEAEGHIDGIRENLSVQDTYLYFNHKKSGALSQAYQLMNNDQGTTLYFYNQAARDFQSQIRDSYLYDVVRIEEIIARFGAYNLLNTHFESYDYDIYDVTLFQDYNGGIKPLMTADASVETSALIAATQYGVEHFDRLSLIEYLKTQLPNESLPLNQKALILWALAAQGEPVLLAVDKFLEVNPYEDLHVKGQVYIASALYEMKDKTRVFEMTNSLFDDLRQNNRLTEQDLVLAATLANRIGLSLSQFEDIATKEYSTKDTIGLQRIYFMHHKPVNFEGASVVIDINGSRKTLELPGVTFEKVIIPKGESFKVVDITKAVHVTEVYEVSGLDYPNYQSRQISINKTFVSENIQQGDVVEVKFTYEKPKDEYVVIRDVIPAGFEFAGYKEHTIIDRYYAIHQDNQLINIPLYSEATNGTISYYIKAVQKGIYHVDPAVIQMYYEEELHMTKPMVIEVE